MLMSTDAPQLGLTDFAAWQRRIERWRRVRHLLDRAELATGRLRRECAQAAASELLLLGDGEALWAFPGPARVAELKQKLEALEPAAAGVEARRIVRLLELYGDAAVLAERDAEATHAYFTTIVLDEDAALLAARLAVDVPGEARGFTPLTSIEEALVATRINPWAEAIVLGGRADRFAAHPTAMLEPRERQLLGAIAGPDPVPLLWLEDWLSTERPALRRRRA